MNKMLDLQKKVYHGGTRARRKYQVHSSYFTLLRASEPSWFN